MDNGSILDEFYDREPGSRTDERQESAECFDVAEAYVAMLDLHLANGDRVALPYSLLMKIEFDPSEGITLRFSTDDVTIKGRRLEPLYKALMQQRVSGIGEASNGHPAANEAVHAVITNIAWESVEE